MTAKTKSINTATDLLAYLKGKDSLAYRYVGLLKRCAEDGYPIGMMEDTIEAEAVSDWEAAACITEREGEDILVEDITEVRETLNRGSDLIQRAGSRKGKSTYALHPALIDTDDA